MSQTWDPRGGPDPNTKTPRFTLPTGACDCHVHIFGPADQFRSCLAALRGHLKRLRTRLRPCTIKLVWTAA